MEEKCLNIESKVVHGHSMFDPLTGAITTPIYQSATFRHPGLYETTGYDYSRLQNPTREELEKTIASLENGKHGFAFSSGMAAITTLIKLFNPGEHIILSDDLYGGTYRICEEIYKRYGLEFEYVDTSSIDNLKAAIKSNTKGAFIETPTNPMMKVTDIREASKICKESGVLLIIDNTFLTPYFQRPLELGADVVVHSATKYLGGHNDTLCGLAVVNNDELAEEIKLIHKSEGAVVSPFDCYLIIRGIKTLAVRLERHEENAKLVAEFLKNHESVDKIYYTGDTDNPYYDVMKKQSSGFGAMISFTVKKVETVEKVLKSVKLITFAESLGGVESLITYPVVQTHGAIPEEIRNAIGVTDKLLRLSVGIENVNDIISDLNQALI
ncbi:cystathionine gamma-lyase MccB [Clostridium cylindrosporum DSM 605]|uniref:Cystathionine gamma-lyase MccB n=1 Tax=Clostridium cylindrosporum DSM 605 TaxID=1121307 RepID=A0A0J8D441_CLOCY|nr:cystathionine gamma-lyase MccB [Clostridium cylindrosporum DSM 605]